MSSTARKKPEEIFTAVEQMPSFPGGESALLKYIDETYSTPLCVQNTTSKDESLLNS